MTKWRYMVNIAEPLAQWEDAGVEATAQAIYARLVDALPEELADATEVWHLDDEITEADDLQDALDRLMDWADYERVWVECYRTETPEWPNTVNA